MQFRDAAEQKRETDLVFHEYLRDMTGVNVPVLGADASPFDVIENGQQRHKLKTILDRKYQELDRALAYNSRICDQTAKLEAQCTTGRVPEALLSRMVALRAEAGAAVRKRLDDVLRKTAS